MGTVDAEKDAQRPTVMSRAIQAAALRPHVALRPPSSPSADRWDTEYEGSHDWAITQDTNQFAEAFTSSETPDRMNTDTVDDEKGAIAQGERRGDREEQEQAADERNELEPEHHRRGAKQRQQDDRELHMRRQRTVTRRQQPQPEATNAVIWVYRWDGKGRLQLLVRAGGSRQLLPPQWWDAAGETAKPRTGHARERLQRACTLAAMLTNTVVDGSEVQFMGTIAVSQDLRVWNCRHEAASRSCNGSGPGCGYEFTDHAVVQNSWNVDNEAMWRGAKWLHDALPRTRPDPGGSSRALQEEQPTSSAEPTFDKLGLLTTGRTATSPHSSPGNTANTMHNPSGDALREWASAMRTVHAADLDPDAQLEVRRWLQEDMEQRIQNGTALEPLMTAMVAIVLIKRPCGETEGRSRAGRTGYLRLYGELARRHGRPLTAEEMTTVGQAMAMNFDCSERAGGSGKDKIQGTPRAWQSGQLSNYHGEKNSSRTVVAAEGKLEQLWAYWKARVMDGLVEGWVAGQETIWECDEYIEVASTIMKALTELEITFGNRGNVFASIWHKDGGIPAQQKYTGAWVTHRLLWLVGVRVQITPHVTWLQLLQGCSVYQRGKDKCLETVLVEQGWITVTQGHWTDRRPPLEFLTQHGLQDVWAMIPAVAACLAGAAIRTAASGGAQHRPRMPFSDALEHRHREYARALDAVRHQCGRSMIENLARVRLVISRQGWIDRAWRTGEWKRSEEWAKAIHTNAVSGRWEVVRRLLGHKLGLQGAGGDYIHMKPDGARMAVDEQPLHPALPASGYATVLGPPDGAVVAYRVLIGAAAAQGGSLTVRPVQRLRRGAPDVRPTPIDLPVHGQVLVIPMFMTPLHATVNRDMQYTVARSDGDGQEMPWQFDVLDAPVPRWRTQPHQRGQAWPRRGLGMEPRLTWMLQG